MTVKELLDTLWRDYVATTPQAAHIQRLLADRGEVVRNDHVALRTFGLAGMPESTGIGIAALARPFEALGWQPRERYRFDDKHLVARYWQHADPSLPKIFISELCVAELSPAAQQIIDRLVAQLPAGFAARDDLPWAGRPWRLRRAEYESLLLVSEYAAWVAAFGLRVNHFTVDVRGLATFPDLAALCAFLREHGFAMNAAGGLVKGSPAERLEQASTLADRVAVAFDDGTAEIPSCYYEFAKRYALPSGELFHGFVPTSADKIFESTDVNSPSGSRSNR